MKSKLCQLLLLFKHRMYSIFKFIRNDVDPHQFSSLIQYQSMEQHQSFHQSLGGHSPDLHESITQPVDAVDGQENGYSSADAANMGFSNQQENEECGYTFCIVWDFS
jgi:hypothetical protein